MRTANTYQADVRALLAHLAAGNRPADLDRVAADLLARSASTPKPISGPIDTAEMTDAQLFAHYKRTAAQSDLTFFLRVPFISGDLRMRAEAISKPTAKDISELRTAWRAERQAYEREHGIPSIGSPRWNEYADILYAPAEPETLASEDIAS